MDEYDLYYYSSSGDESDSSHEFEFTSEEWQDWNSEVLLNLWMSIVEYHEEWYLPLRKTFNEFCEFVWDRDPSLDNSVELDNDTSLDKGEPLDRDTSLDSPPEIQAIKNHPLIKGLDWNKFFSAHK